MNMVNRDDLELSAQEKPIPPRLRLDTCDFSRYCQMPNNTCVISTGLRWCFKCFKRVVIHFLKVVFCVVHLYFCIRSDKKAQRKINTHYLCKDSRMLCFPVVRNRKTTCAEAHLAQQVALLLEVLQKVDGDNFFSECISVYFY